MGYVMASFQLSTNLRDLHLATLEPVVNDSLFSRILVKQVLFGQDIHVPRE